MSNAPTLNIPSTPDEIRRQMADVIQQIRELPIGTDLSRNPLEDILIRHPDSTMRDPWLYAEIFRRARMNPPTLTFERDATLLLEEINGARRDVSDMRTLEAIIEDHSSITDLLSNVDDPARRGRLASLSDYHGGQLLKMGGDYDGEAACYGRSIARMTRDSGATDKIRDTMWTMQIAQLNAATKANNLKLMQATWNRMLDFWKIQSEGNGGTWWFNGPVRILVSSFVCGLSTRESLPIEHMFWHVRDREERISEFWKQFIVEALDLYMKDDYANACRGAYKTLEDTTPSSSKAEADCAALLMLARCHRDQGEHGEAIAAYGDLVNYSANHGAHWIRAVGARELMALQGLA